MLWTKIQRREREQEVGGGRIPENQDKKVHVGCYLESISLSLGFFICIIIIVPTEKKVRALRMTLPLLNNGILVSEDLSSVSLL